MRLARISICVTGLAIGALAVTATGASAVSPCAPGQPSGRPPGTPPNAPAGPVGRPPQYPPGKCQLQLSAASAAASTSVTAAGSGFLAGSTVGMRLGSVDVASVTAGSDGSFTQGFTIPANTAPGQYDVQATGTGAGGAPYQQAATLEVTPLQVAAAGQPTLLPGLRSGAGLAAAPASGGSKQVGGTGQSGFTTLVPTGPGGGLTVLPGSLSGTGGQSTLDHAGSPLVLGTSTAAPGQGVAGAAVTGPGSDGLNPLVALAGGLSLAGVGAGTIVVARRRRTSTP